MKQNSKSIQLIGCIIFSCILYASCTEERYITIEEQVHREYCFAVVLPFSNGMESVWKQSVNWAIENLNASLIPLQHIRLTVEWHDEDIENTEILFQALANRKDLHAIIGPLYSAHALTAAKYCARSGKTLIPALATSAGLMRAYAGKGFLWCLTENDISQCEVLLAKAKQKGALSVSLLAADNDYGRTFTEWFGFQAQELGLKVHSVETYNSVNLKQKTAKLLQEDTDCVLCVSSNTQETQIINTIRCNGNTRKPFLLFSDAAFLTHPTAEYEGMEGIAVTHNPQSGFHINYEARYGKLPELGTAHFYDAVLLAGLGCLLAELKGEEDINQAMMQLVQFQGAEINGCTQEGVQCIVKALLSGYSPHITGASGKLHFDTTLHTNVLHSVYCHWIIYQGKHLILEYNTSDDANRTATSVVNWKRRVTQMQKFEANERVYTPRKGLYALLVAGSSGWDNYRHQANVYAWYHLLKANGLKDKQIVMVAENDLAAHEDNPFPGEVRLWEEGKNLYPQKRLTIRPSETSWQNFSDKLLKKEILTHCDSTSNIIVYWAGHGLPEGVKWADETISSSKMALFFRQLAEQKRFRKALLLLETCYSGKVGEQCQGIPGLLCMTAANAIETSKADRYSALFSTWLSNSFTDGLLKNLSQNQDISIYELYAKLYNHTIGSHVSVYNATYFANLYRNSINEFLYPVYGSNE